MSTAAIRRAVGREFDRILERADPPYERVRIASQYVWPGELVWRNDAPNISRFVTFGLSDKKPGFGAVYLGWSRLKRFPEKSIRPWFGGNFDFARDAIAPEGTLFLSTVASGAESWNDYGNESPTNEAIHKTIQALLTFGLPFLGSLD
jgi:hypothetical protein